MQPLESRLAEPPILLLVRHGETASNLSHRFAGWNDDQLTEGGREGVVELARALGFRGGRLYASPVRRAVDTAEILATELGLEVRTVHDLHELEVGEWKGLTEEEVSERWPEAYRAWLETPDILAVKGRESLEELRERARSAIDQIGRAELSEDASPALVVTHLALIRVLWLAARDRPLSEYHSVAGHHGELYPLLWEGRGKLRVALGDPVSVDGLATGQRPWEGRS